MQVPCPCEETCEKEESSSQSDPKKLNLKQTDLFVFKSDDSTSFTEGFLHHVINEELVQEKIVVIVRKLAELTPITKVIDECDELRRKFVWVKKEEKDLFLTLTLEVKKASNFYRVKVLELGERVNVVKRGD